MPTNSDVHVGDIGTTFKGRVIDAGAPFDITTVVSAALRFDTPTGVIDVVPTVTTDGTNWYLEYRRISSDGLNAAKGKHRWQGTITFGDGSIYHTSIADYLVKDNL